MMKPADFSVVRRVVGRQLLRPINYTSIANPNLQMQL